MISLLPTNSEANQNRRWIATSANFVRPGRPPYILAAFAALLLTSVILYTVPHSASIIPFSIKDHGPWNDRRILEFEGLPLGDPFVSSDSVELKEDVDLIQWLLDATHARFQEAMSGQSKLPSCAVLHPERYAKTALAPQSYRPWRGARRESVVAIAINLHNSEDIIPSQSRAVLTAVSYLLTYNKVFVSVYENGSTDRTRALLSDFGAALHAIGVDGLWMHSSRMLSDFAGGDRIDVLSEIRNLAIHPLVPYATNSAGEGTLVFLNDVVTCASDVLELIHQRRLHQADLAAGMDWTIIPRNIHPGDDPEKAIQQRVPRVYDLWVGRGINGDLVYPFAEPSGFTPASPNETWVTDAWSTQDEPTYNRWLDGAAFPIYSGWGGMAAFDASLFTRDHLRFRSSITSGWTGGSYIGALGHWGRLVGTKGYLESDCPGASECQYIARDIWNLRKGKARIVLAPRARTVEYVDDMALVGDTVPPAKHDDVDEPQRDTIDWEAVAIPETVVCIAGRDSKGDKLFPWDPESKRQRLDPLWRPPGSLEAL